MAKKRAELSAPAKRRGENAKHIPEREIDFSDVPELTEEELTKGRRVGRPKSDHAKQLIAFRIDPRLLTKLRKLASKKRKPYQTLLHELLEEAIKEAA